MASDNQKIVLAAYNVQWEDVLLAQIKNSMNNNCTCMLYICFPGDVIEGRLDFVECHPQLIQSLYNKNLQKLQNKKHYTDKHEIELIPLLKKVFITWEVVGSIFLQTEFVVFLKELIFNLLSQ